MSIFFSISAFLKCGDDKSNTNRPDWSIFGRADQFDQHRDHVITSTAKFVFNIVLVAPLPNIPHFGSIPRSIVCYDNMFQFFSRQTPSTSFLLAINIRAPQSTPTPLTKHAQVLPNNMKKNDYIFFRHNKKGSKTVNGKKVSLPLESRNQLYRLDKWTIGIDQDDLHRSLDGVVANHTAPALSISRAHDPMKCLKHHLKAHPSWYIIPDHFYSSKIYSKALKAAYNHLKENNPDFHMQGWWTMESWERHTAASNHLLFATGPLIDWKWAVDKVVVHHGTAPMLAALHSFELHKGNVPERPYVSIHINTQKKAAAPSSFTTTATMALTYNGPEGNSPSPRTFVTLRLPSGWI